MARMLRAERGEIGEPGCGVPTWVLTEDSTNMFVDMLDMVKVSRGDDRGSRYVGRSACVHCCGIGKACSGRGRSISERTAQI